MASRGEKGTVDGREERKNAVASPGTSEERRDRRVASGRNEGKERASEQAAKASKRTERRRKRRRKRARARDAFDSNALRCGRRGVRETTTGGRATVSL